MPSLRFPHSSHSMDKAAIRKRMREMRRAMADDAIRDRSRAAQGHILDSDEWRLSPSVGLYVAVRKETDTVLLAENAWREGKEVYFPHSLPGGIMHFLPCHGWRELQKGLLGIPEPTPESCPLPPEGGWVPKLIVTPGIAFDREGHRLGQGGGYYDRYFAKDSTQDVIRIGLAYEFQILETLPADEWDAPMHAVATEKGLIWL